MKKNISINISGIIFHIEEDGYETLRKYLDSVNRYFASFDDSSEILADIESRIAEIFLSRLNEGKQVITGEDVATLITTMGSVSDFKAAEETEFAGPEPTAFKEKEKERTGPSTGSKKLFRDQNKKVFGGVCSGLGHYFNVDPVWPRLLFVLLFFGYGITLIVYIFMWVLLPSTTLEDQPSVKKMYRNPDKKVFGGVCSGLCAFFGMDLTTVRVLFVLMGLFFGSGIVLYIVLWIAIPEAKTITEKMEMQGEPVTLSNIESSVKKGLNEKDGEESILAKIILFPFRALAAVINGLVKFLGPAFSVLIDVLRVAIGIIISLTGLMMIITLIMVFGIIMGIFHAPDWAVVSDWYLSTPNLPLKAMRNSFPAWTVVFTFLVALIPSIFVLLIGNSIVVRRVVFNSTVGWSLFVILFVSAAAISFSLPQIILGFKEEGEYKIEQTFALNGKTTVFKMNETGMDDYDVTDISLKGYDGKEIKLVEQFQAQGTSRKIASENAQMVDYQVVQSDSVITFDSNITFKPEAKFRAQRLDVDVFIPYNQKVMIDAALWRIIDTDVLYYTNRSFRNLNFETQTWMMTEKGLQCTSCPDIQTDASNPAQDQFGFKDFNSVDLEGMFTVSIEKGDVYAVEIKGPETERKRYDVYVNGETLVIDYDDHRKFFWKRTPSSDEKIRISITMPNLRELEATGLGKLRFSGFNEDEIDISLTGAISASADNMTANNMSVKLTGASILDISGHGNFLDADILGASGLKAYGYPVDHCIVEAHGASSARVNVTGTLEIKKGIASSVSHRGNPEIIKR